MGQRHRRAAHPRACVTAASAGDPAAGDPPAGDPIRLLTILLKIFRIATCECLTTRRRMRAGGPGVPGASAVAGAQGRRLAGERLRQAILAGDMAPGQRLVEEELAGMLGVTRASLRAALFDLTADGLVERIPNRGARVRAITLDEAVAITECRMALEGLCAAKAAERVTEPEAARLRQLGEELQRSVADGEPLKYSALNRRAAPAGAGDFRPDGGGRPARAAERAAGPAPVPAVAAPRAPPGVAARAPGDHRRDRRARARGGRGGHPPPPAQRHHGPARSAPARSAQELDQHKEEAR